ncbi:membrane protein [Actinoallomurus vinaceus]|uniref:Membrane protein n=1 Tax=Actinoallomurus vinaceus TaxID=1080074 RepID=A0ABP8U337_9ACTN
MSKILLILHVLAAVIAVGPVTVAGSMFPSAVRRAAAAPDRPEPVAAVRLLHQICRVYALVGLAVPVFGFATASSMHVLGSPWLIVSIVLTGVAALVLALLVLPAQEIAIAGLSGSGADTETAATRLEPAQIRRLAMLTGAFNLLWATVTILMIVRPGSTTGA